MTVIGSAAQTVTGTVIDSDASPFPFTDFAMDVESGGTAVSTTGMGGLGEVLVHPGGITRKTVALNGGANCRGERPNGCGAGFAPGKGSTAR